MRLLFSSVLGLGLLGAVAGCHCTMGGCDCDYYGGYGSPLGAAYATPASSGYGGPVFKTDMAHEMPKGDNKPAAGSEASPGL